MIRRAVMLLLFLLPCTMLQASELGDARLSYIKGDVLIFSEEANDWVPASVNTPLGEEDRLWVSKDGRAEITLAGGVYLRLDEETALDLLALEDDDWQFFLGEGRLYINNRQGGINHIQIDTPRTSVSSYDNSIIILDTNPNNLLLLSVLKGYSQVETERGTTGVDAGRSLRILSNLSGETAPLAEPDSWEQWNHRRDQKQLAASESLRYIPDEMDDSAPELDANGTWLFSSEFGYVWRPHLSLSTGWAPYRDGRWVWRFGTYTWISYEPWGWAPYHYGRWAYLGGSGWCWVPPPRHEVVWAPGYVAWVEYRDHVAWVPLAPGEAYYGHIPRRRGSPPPPPQAGTRPVYRNITINNAITVINRETFLTGRKQKVTLRENPFLSREGSTRAPTIKPVKESTAPMLRAIAPNRKPPEMIIRTTPKQIREERKLRRSEHDSVLRQGAPAAELPVTKRPGPRILPKPDRLEQKERRDTPPLSRVPERAVREPAGRGSQETNRRPPLEPRQDTGSRRVSSPRPPQDEPQKKLQQNNNSGTFRQGAPAAELPATKLPESRTSPTPDQLERNKEQKKRRDEIPPRRTPEQTGREAVRPISQETNRRPALEPRQDSAPRMKNSPKPPLDNAQEKRPKGNQGNPPHQGQGKDLPEESSANPEQRQPTSEPGGQRPRRP